MRNELTDVTIILDRSGSMGSVCDDTMGGFNTFIKTQQAVPGECHVSLIQFDHEYIQVYEARNVKAVPFLDKVTYVPRGNTALLDAMGRTIVATGERLSNMAEADRPAKVLVVVITDGFENASREYTREKVFEMIQHQKDGYAWDFVFLGANQDAIHEGAKYGFGAGKSMSVAHTAEGTSASYDALSRYVGSVRGMSVGEVANAAFSEDERKQQKDAGAQ